jgi:hypothetical protein
VKILHTNARAAAAALTLLVMTTACSGDESGAPGSPSPSLSAPSIDAPAADAQLDTLRPTLTVRNSTSTASGARTYEFQIADNTGFSPVALTRSDVAENASGRTAFTPAEDLPASTRLYWRARVRQGSASSDWSATGSFRTKAVGFNRPGQLYDPLIHGETLGTPVGTHAFVSGDGLRLDSENAYVRYQLSQTLPAGEMSVEVKGLRANGPGTQEGSKLKIFSMMDGTGDLIASRYQLSVQYRGVNGNPDNCISFKAVWGDRDVKLEPDFAQRAASVQALDPSRWYLWTATWTATTFRLVVRQDSATGTVIYDRTAPAPPGTGPYAPSPHFVYLGANSGAYGTETGSWPGVTFRNLWVGTGPRP